MSGWLDIFGGDEVTNETTNLTQAPNAPTATSGQQSPSTSTNAFDSTVTVTNVTTDGGAVEEALDFARESQQENNDLITNIGNAAADIIVGFGNAARDLVEDSLVRNQEVTEAAIASSNRAIEEGLDFGRRSLDTVDDAIISNENIARESILLASDVSDLVEDIHVTNVDYLTNTNSEFVGALEDMDESRNQTTAQVLEAVGDLATVVQTGGDSITESVNKAMLLAGLALAGFVVWRVS